MSDTGLVAPIVSTLAAVAFAVLARLIDRYVPDPEHEHPLPTPPATGRHAGE